MKKLFIVLFAAAVFANISSAYNYICGQSKSSAYEVNDGIWSKLQWTLDEYAQPGKAKIEPKGPGPRDDATIRNRWRVKVDQDVKVNNFRLETINNVWFEPGKTLETRKDLIIRLVLMGDNFIEFKGGKAVIGGNIDMSNRDMDSTLGTAGVRLIDSQMTARGSIIAAIRAAEFKQMSKPGGITLYLEGKSSLIAGGDLLADLQYQKYADRIGFNIVFKEKDGNIPMLSFNGGDFSPCKFLLDIKNAAKGKYPLICLSDKKSTVEKLLSLTVNGKKVKVGEEFKVGDTVGSLNFDSGDKDKNKNDLVLEVK